jgi:hypothetical protein
MNIIGCKNTKLKVKKWGHFLGSPKRGPFLHGLALIIKMTISVNPVRGMKSKTIYEHLGSFVRKT